MRQSDKIAPRTGRSRIARAVGERDRVFTILALPAFGAWSLADPTPSMAQLPGLAACATYWVFIAAGVFLAGSVLRQNMAAFVMGHLLAIVGLLTLSGVVLTTSESPVAVVVFGFATAMSYSLQKALRERELLREVAARDRTDLGGPDADS